MNRPQVCKVKTQYLNESCINGYEIKGWGKIIIDLRYAAAYSGDTFERNETPFVDI